MGIALRDTSGEFRSMEDVIDEVGNAWESYNSVQQQQIATAIAGEFAPEHTAMYGQLYCQKFPKSVKLSA